MLAPIVLAALLLELMAYAALGASVVTAFAIAFGARLAISLATFAFAWAYRTPREPAQRLSAIGTLSLVLREYAGLLRLNFAELPLEFLLMGRDPAPRPAERPAVLLLHGYFVNRGSLRGLRARLEALGVEQAFTPNLRSWMASIERFEEDIAAEVERIAQGTGRKVVIVAHSMGGLGTRLALTRHADRIERVVTIASPHHGTALAPLGLGANARQMARGSAFLAALERAEAAQPPSVPFTSVYSVHDNLVAPQETSRLAYARNVALAGRGHLGILACDDLAGILRDELAQAGVLPATPR